MFVFIDERTQDRMYLPRMLQIDIGSIDGIKIGQHFLNIDSETVGPPPPPSKCHYTYFPDML